MKILFVLQNAYRSEKHQFETHAEWYRELNFSQTGKRLQEMVPDGAVWLVINASPLIGTSASSCYPANTTYILEKIEELKPDCICACGKIAQAGLNTLGIKFYAAPHPAWRALSKKITKQIKEDLSLYEPA
jgi:hypothetical protein